MIGEVRNCANDGCNIEFVSKTHNQKYHDAECCRLATNRKIMEKYYARRAQRLGHKRFCMKCESELSRYNNANMCNSCLNENESIRNTNTKMMLSSVLAG